MLLRTVQHCESITRIIAQARANLVLRGECARGSLVGKHADGVVSRVHRCAIDHKLHRWVSAYQFILIYVLIYVHARRAVDSRHLGQRLEPRAQWMTPE